MAPDEKPLSIEPAEWTDKAGAMLAEAAPFGSLAEIRAQGVEGPAVLFHIYHGGDLVGAFVLRVDHTATGNEGVIVAGAAKVQGVDMLALCMPHIESLFHGCARIRYHTSRPALARRLLSRGYAPREIVSVKEIEHATVTA